MQLLKVGFIQLWKAETLAQKRWRWYLQPWQTVGKTQEQKQLVKECRLLEKLTEKQMFSVHKQLDLISNHLWLPAHSWFFSFFVCCCCREAGSFFSSYRCCRTFFFFSFRIYFLLSHPIRDLTTDETAANRSLHCLLQTNVSRFTVYWELCWWSWKSNRTSFCLSCRLHPASAPPSSTCGDAATVASPAWWTWRCGGTLHAPPAWPGRSGRSGCRLWRTPALGSAAHTDLCWRLLTQLYVQSSFYRISRILLHGNVTVSTATVTVNTALPNTCVSTLVTFQRTENHPELQKLARSEVSSLLPHTFGVEMSFLTPFWGRAARPAQPGEGRNDLPGWNRLILPGILSLSAWNMLNLNSALKIKVSDLSLEPASTCCCVVSTQRKWADQLVRGYIWNVEVSSQLCCRQMAAQWCWLGHCYLHGDNMTTSTVRAEMEMNPHPCDLPGRLCSISLYPLNIHTDMTSLTCIYL